MSLRILGQACFMILAASACAHLNHQGALLVQGATVIDPSAGAVLKNHCIWITGDRINSVEPCAQTETPHQVIEASGKWAIPGLWDMHVHAVWDDTVYRDFFADFVAFGVVGIRDMGGNAGTLVEAREFLSQPWNVGPELIAAGMVLDGPSPIHPEIAIAVGSAEEGRHAVAQIDELGADFVKIYTTLPQAAVYAVFDEARKRSMQVAGHLPSEFKLADAMDGGMASIEHMAVETGGLCDPDDEAVCDQMFAQLRDSGIYLTPTLLIRQRPGSIKDPNIAEKSRVESMPEILANQWKTSLHGYLSPQSEDFLERKAQQFLQERRLTEIAIASASLILVGTDSGDFLVPPGSSMHEELELLVSAGMDEMSALFAATRRAADFLKLSDRGRIQAGAIADLVILNSDPLIDIRNTRDINSVVLRGIVLDSADLDCLKSRKTCE